MRRTPGRAWLLDLLQLLVKTAGAVSSASDAGKWCWFIYPGRARKAERMGETSKTRCPPNRHDGREPIRGLGSKRRRLRINSHE